MHHWRHPVGFETQWLLPCAGDTQALAPATAEQAADASAPKPGLEGAAEEEEDEPMAEDAQEEPLLAADDEASGKDQVPIPSLPMLPQSRGPSWYRHQDRSVQSLALHSLKDSY